MMTLEAPLLPFPVVEILPFPLTPKKVFLEAFNIKFRNLETNSNSSKITVRSVGVKTNSNEKFKCFQLL